jgi:hypothetical protein
VSKQARDHRLETRSGKVADSLKMLRVSKTTEKILEVEKRRKARERAEEKRPQWTRGSKAFESVERRLNDRIGGSDVARLKGRQRRFLEQLQT